MRKSIAATAAAVTLAAAAWLLQPIPSHEAAAQSAPFHIHAVDIDVVPGQIDNYLAALKENGAASVKEPGCREFDTTVSQKDANHVFIFEVYDDAAAAQVHRETEHFKKYAATDQGHGCQARGAAACFGGDEYQATCDRGALIGANDRPLHFQAFEPLGCTRMARPRCRVSHTTKAVASGWTLRTYSSVRWRLCAGRFDLVMVLRLMPG